MLGKRNTIYAFATLEDLREQEEQILVDQHDGLKANIKNVTVNDVYELWCQLKRGIKDSTMKNYIYMYELFVKPTFGKKKLVQVKKSDVRRFYNQLIDDKVLKPSTVDVIHNIVHQVFQIAVDDDMVRSNPAANMLREIKMAHGSEIEKRKALTLEQGRTVSWLSGQNFKIPALVSCLLYYGEHRNACWRNHWSALVRCGYGKRHHQREPYAGVLQPQR